MAVPRTVTILDLVRPFGVLPIGRTPTVLMSPK